MNREQASRILAAEPLVAYLARFDAGGNLLSGWHRGAAEPPWWQVPGQVEGLREAAANRIGSRAVWGTSPGDQVARQITVDELTGIMALLIPVPGGGFVVAALERWVFGQAAGAVADRLEAALQREFGPTWAPLVAVGVAAGLLLLLAWGRPQG